MRILFVTNYYPPSSRGWGYMQLCEGVAEGLVARGHDIAVLTSTQQDGSEPERSYPIWRWLTIEPDWNGSKPASWQFFFGRRKRERKSVQCLLAAIDQFRPQLIFVWHPIGLSRTLLQTAEQQSDIEIIYYLADYWPELSDEYVAYWQANPVRPIAKVLKGPLRILALNLLKWEGKPLSLSFSNAICVSQYVKQRLVSQGLLPQDAIVIHNGIDVSKFSPSSQIDFSADVLSCLVAGRIVPEKGIHTVVEAFAQLSSQDEMDRLCLVILGSGPSDYVEQLRRTVDGMGLQGSVRFMPPVPRNEMPRVLSQHQVLILSSEYEEPIARSMQEAMAVGLLVVGTTTGGSGELLEHKRTGLAFDAGDAQSLAQQLRFVLRDPHRSAGLAKMGQIRVRREFSIDRTIARIETYLHSLLG